jgi:hypothetical protein
VNSCFLCFGIPSDQQETQLSLLHHRKKGISNDKITQLSHCYVTYCSSIQGYDTGTFDSCIIPASRVVTDREYLSSLLQNVLVISFKEEEIGRISSKYILLCIATKLFWTITQKTSERLSTVLIKRNHVYIWMWICFVRR